MLYELITRDSDKKYVVHDYAFDSEEKASACAKWLRTSDPKYMGEASWAIATCSSLRDLDIKRLTAPIVGYAVRERDGKQWVKYRGNVRDIHKTIPKE